MSDSSVCKIKVAGEFACFTRPELKVERVSYPVPTPSAVRGVFEAILFRPQFRWHPVEIAVLNPIKYISLRRNEVKGKISTHNVELAMRGTKALLPLYADDMDSENKGRTPRQTQALRDVCYVFAARIQLTPAASAPSDTIQKYREQFLRRAERGQCFFQPYLGCREFAASFEIPNGSETPLRESRDLGWMVYDIFDLEGPTRPVLDEAQLRESRRLSLFEARMENGVIRIPEWNSSQIKKGGQAS